MTGAAQRKMKPSGVEWSTKPLKHVVTLNPDELPEQTSPDFEIEYVDIGNVTLADGVTATETHRFEQAPSRARRRVQHGDTIISTVRTYLKAVAFMRDPPPNRIVSTGFAVLRPGGALEPRFLYRVVQGEEFIGRVVAESTGVSYPAISPSQLGRFPVHLPPLPEQRSIADYLDAKTAKIDALIEKKRRFIELLQEKRTALISHAVTKGLNPNVRMKPSGVEWLGEVPEHWARIRVKVVAAAAPCSFTDGDWIETPYITSAGVRLIQTGNIGVGAYKEQGFRYISDEAFTELDCTAVEPGDVLICRLAAPVGRACLAPSLGGRMITSVDVCILRPKNEFDSRYLVYFMSSNRYLGFVDSLCRGGTRDRISRSMLGDLSIPSPPYAEQRQISEHLDAETKKVDAILIGVESAIARLQEYRTAVITSAVTGKLDLQRAALEYAAPVAQPLPLAAEASSLYGDKD